MSDPYLAPVVYDGRRFVLCVSRVPLTGVEILRAAGYDAEHMVAAWPDLVLDEVTAYLADDLVETESVAYARADARDYAERKVAARVQRGDTKPRLNRTVAAVSYHLASAPTD